LRHTGQIQPLGFSIRCDDFDVSFYDTGAPKEYRSRLTVLENGQPVRQQDILVNEPLRYGGINIFQSSYGVASAKGATLQFQSAESKMVYTVPAGLGQRVNVPENGGTFVIDGYRNAIPFRGHNIGEGFVGTLETPDGRKTQVVLPLRFSDFDRMRNGQWVISAIDPQYRFYTGLQVTKDPSVGIVYTGFLLMIIGCFVTFFTSHQRLCIAVAQAEHRCVVWVAGLTNKNPLGMEKKMEMIAEKLERLSQRNQEG